MVEAKQTRLLIVDDDAEFRGTLARRFLRRGYDVREAADAIEALEGIKRQGADVAILDMVMPGLSGLELLERLKAQLPTCEALLLTGQGTIETAVKAMKLGAYDFLTKPFPLAELELLIQRASEHRDTVMMSGQLAEGGQRGGETGMLGSSPAMQAVFRLVERAGPTEKAILIEGESGTGKELVARALHRHSMRADKPLVVINCAALPEALLESELFGHEKGSFTGATATKQGLFEVADGATLFIDEIGELAGSLQAKLLRVLEDGTFRRVGGLKENRVNVRLIAATNRDLAGEVRAGRFREDLYYRINVMALRLPPLRERVGDIAILVKHFLTSEWQIEPEALAALERYPWPGNIRQLINVIDRGKIMADDHTIRRSELPSEIVNYSGSAPVAEPVADREVPKPDDLRTVERAHVIEVLRREHGNKARAARALGVTRRSLYRLLERHGIRGDDPAEYGSVQTSPDDSRS